MQATQQRRVV
uniref:Uncharacterized protein n=1 Tax=Rhizophora mucronata TaxID=61149 RepID=A0A2P2NM77_RHIMU